MDSSIFTVFSYCTLLHFFCQTQLRTAFANTARNDCTNCVGYQNKNLQLDGQLVTPVFQQIGDGEKYHLLDLKVTGYENVEAYKTEGYFDSQIYFTRLNKDGVTMNTEKFGAEACQFSFVAIYEGGEWVDTFWTDFGGNEIRDPKDPNNAEFDYGEGVWLVCPPSIEGETYKLVTDGQVAASDIYQPLKLDGNMVGNVTPVPVWVSDLDITGYENVEQYKSEGYFDSQIYFTRLNKDGVTMNTEKFGDEACQFSFVAIYEEGEWVDKFWTNFAGSEIHERGGEDDAQIQPGEVLWVVAPPSLEGETYQFVTPSALNPPIAE